MMLALNDDDVRRLAAESCRDVRSVRKVLKGDASARPTVVAAVTAAAARLGLPVPPRAA
jgi:hypothetical protein